MRTSSNRRWVAGAALVGVMLAGSAAGQPASSSRKVQALTPPKAQVPDNPGMFLTYVCLLAIVGAAVGANMIPSKRGHQD